jgi:hypothetical protein
MGCLIPLLLFIVIVIISLNRQPENQQPAPQPVAVQQGKAITPGDTRITKNFASLIASDLYRHDFILEFEPGGRPFQTTESSKIANRRTQLAIISEMKAAASREDKQIAADINLLQVLWDRNGDLHDRDVAMDKLVKDLKKFQNFNDTPAYKTDSPWGWIIAEMESYRAHDDEEERKDRADAEAVDKAKAAAGTAAPAAGDPNNWNDVVAGRVAAGAKTTKECRAGGSYCITTTTSPADEYGTVRQMFEYTGTVTEQWECSIDRGSDIRLCGTFWPGLWRAEKRTPDGHFVVVKTGTIEEVYDALGWPH